MKVASSQAVRPKAARDRRQHTGRVLIVDDEPAMVASLAELLIRDGHEVAGAHTETEARTLLGENSYDLVIADVVMPDGGGMEVLRAAHDSDGDCPVIMMTAYASVEAAVGAINEGAYDFLVKPIDLTELSLTVRRAVEKRHLTRATRKLMDDLGEANRILARRVAELNALHDVSAAMSGTAELPKLLDRILLAATGVIGARYGSVLLLDLQAEGLVVEAATGRPPGSTAEVRVALGDSIAGYVATTGEPVLIADVETDPRFARRNRPQFETRSLVAAPLRTPQNVLGVICLSDPTHRKTFVPDDLKLLATLATQAAIVIDDARHYEELRQRLNEVTVLHELANRLTEVERTDQMVMAVFAAWDNLLVSDRLQWWRWDHTDRVLRLDTDTPHSIQERTKSPATGVLSVEALSENGICGDALRAALAEASWEFVPGACLTIPVRSSQQPLGVFAVMRSAEHSFDESEQRLAHLVGAQAERIFERQRALLNASRLVTMGKMISEISHDLRKPLTNIRGSLHVLTDGRKTPEEAAEILAATDEEIVRLAALVKELVDFSNPTRYRTERRDIRRILLRAIELIRQSAKKHRIDIIVDIPPALRSVFCDDNQLTEAFLNILINAIEAMGDGGRLSVTARVEPTHEDGGEIVSIAISDTGPGMSERERERIFERYYTTKPTGTGLGLPIVQRIVNSCEGTITAESTPGIGTTFQMRFPVP